MIDTARGDICRYYGGTKKVNGLEPVDGRKSAQDALPPLRTALRHKLKTVSVTRDFRSPFQSSVRRD